MTTRHQIEPDMMRIPHIPASVTALMTAIVFIAPLVVLFILHRGE